MCDQCEAVTINGVYCHEHGCPNAPKVCTCCGEDFVPRYNGDHLCEGCHEAALEATYGFDPYDEEAEPEQRFADPGGNSSLYAETETNKRIYPCPTCGLPNRLTRRDQLAHYQCDACANQQERGGY